MGVHPICTECQCKCGCNSAGSTTFDGSECISVPRKDNETGVCCASDGTCTCKGGYSGDNCEELECPIGTFKDENEGNVNCGPCHENCDGCTGPGSDECIACKQGYSGDNCDDFDLCPLGTFNDEQNCVNECPITKYEDNGHCKLCHEYCDGCTGPGVDNCINCKNSKDGIYCVNECPSTKYEDDGHCKPCHENCDGCTGPGADNCITCKNSKMDGEFCVPECPDGCNACKNTKNLDHVLILLSSIFAIFKILH